MNKQQLAEFRTKFLFNTDETGRFLVRSKATNTTYFVEPVGKIKTNWGDINPATGKVEGKYGTKYRGSIDKDDSMITNDNELINIELLRPGVSPLFEIERRDNLKLIDKL